MIFGLRSSGCGLCCSFRSRGSIVSCGRQGRVGSRDPWIHARCFKECSLHGFGSLFYKASATLCMQGRLENSEDMRGRGRLWPQSQGHPCPGDEPSHPRQPLTADACTSRDKDLRLLGRAAWLQHQRHEELKLSLWAEDGTRLRRANSTQRWLSDVIAKHPARVRIQEPTCKGTCSNRALALSVLL